MYLLYASKELLLENIRFKLTLRCTLLQSAVITSQSVLKLKSHTDCNAILQFTQSGPHFNDQQTIRLNVAFLMEADNELKFDINMLKCHN